MTEELLPTTRYYRGFVIDAKHEIAEEQARHTAQFVRVQFAPEGSPMQFAFFERQILVRVEYYGRRDMSETVLRHLAAHRGVRFDVQGVRRPASGYVWECFHNLDGVGLPAGTVLTLADGNERGVMEIERGADSGIVEITKYAWSSSGDLLKVLRYDGDGQFVEGWDLVGEESVSPRLYELLASQNEFLRSGLTLPREFDGATIPTCTAFGDEQT